MDAPKGMNTCYTEQIIRPKKDDSKKEDAVKKSSKKEDDKTEAHPFPNDR